MTTIKATIQATERATIQATERTTIQATERTTIQATERTTRMPATTERTAPLVLVGQQATEQQGRAAGRMRTFCRADYGR